MATPAYTFDERTTRILLQMAKSYKSPVPNAAGKRNILQTPIGGEVWVQILTNAAGNGKYNGRVVAAPDAKILATNALLTSQLARDSDPSSLPVLICNAQEADGNSSTGHDLAGVLQPFKGTVWQLHDDGTVVVIINGIMMDACNEV